MAEEIAARLKTATAPPAATAALATAIYTAASSARLAACRATDISPDAKFMILHDSWPSAGCRRHPMPPWTRPFLHAARFLRLTAPSTAAPVFTDPFDTDRLPDLTRLAEACKLRPPQPPGRRRHPVWPDVTSAATTR